MIEKEKIQSEAADKVLTSFHQGIKKGYIYIPPGSGRSIIVAEIVTRFLLEHSGANILIVFRTLAEVDHFNTVIHGVLAENHNISNITTVTYSRLLNQKRFESIREFSLVVLFDSNQVHAPLRNNYIFIEFTGHLLGVFSYPQIPASNIFFNSPAFYLYDDHNTRFTEYWYINNLIIPMLRRLGFSDVRTEEKILTGVRSARADIIALNNGVGISLKSRHIAARPTTRE